MADCRETLTRAARLGFRLLREDCGQDLVEYALLTAGLGLVSSATWPAIADTIGSVYQALDQNTQGLWVPPDPGGGP